MKPRYSILVVCITLSIAMTRHFCAEDAHTRPPLPSKEEIAKLPEDGGDEFNRLIFEKSPYLLQHARNPIDWYPWGEEAFKKAAEENKPVFMSVGYTTCHWCHVMEHESFEDDAVAKLLNDSYIAVKVDREERPDVDEVYMTVTQGLTGGRGGWPMTVIMTPALRSILRQDPDVIMVGEVRDAETAQYATQAALTGHLVLSTLHTNDAASAISRLVDLDIERFMIRSTLIGTMAQRLVRRICTNCAVDTYLDDEQIQSLRLSVQPGTQISVRQGAGCGECRGTGYRGRTGIFEIMAVDDAVKELIQTGADSARIKREVVKNGMRTLRQSALRKLAQGATSFEEVVRVTGL
ncbi:MAG: ATPase, T2SS/T4P/T4SS family [Planctomycetota bacterium]